MNKIKKITAIALSAVMVFSFAACGKEKEEEQTTQEVVEEMQPAEPISATCNPLTGRNGYDANMIGKRPVSIVVENSPAARPQWGITTPDIIVEGEVEGGITRMLWLYANYNDIPDEVGPVRSARPSYVKFSTLFDSIFIHWGGSNNHAPNYTGGYETIEALKVNDLDGMAGGDAFGRNKSKKGGSEHTGVVKGKNVVNAITNKKYRMDINNDKFTAFSFYDKATNVGNDVANNVNIKFSSRTDTRKFTYNAENGTYNTNDWKTNVSFNNLIVLMDKTNYINTTDGKKTTYLNYELESGDGYLISNGTMTPIKWDAKSGKIKFTNSDGNEMKINVGDSYIALASSNNGGSVNCN